MKPSWRSGFTLLGTLLVYAAFLMQSRAGYLEPLPAVSWFQPVLGTLVMAVLAYIVGFALAVERSALAVAAISVIFFLLNPLLNEPRFLLEPWLSLRVPLLTLAMAAIWLNIQDWSIFMRSGVLLLGFSAMFLLAHGGTFIWIGALVVWMLFNRRRMMAIGAFVLIVLGGWVLSEVARFLHALIFTHQGALLSVGDDFHQRYAQGVSWPAWISITQAREQATAAINLLSLPWMLLALQTVALRLLQMIDEKRSDAASWLACVTLLTALSGIFCQGDASRDIQRWLLFSACACPLAGHALAQREFLMSRPARVTALAGMFFSAAAVWVGHSGTMVAALAMAFIFSWWRVQAPWMTLTMRWTAVLGGATLGAWLAEGFILFRT